MNGEGDEESAKRQHPSTREAPNSKLQTKTGHWCLELGASLVLGCWSLELFPNCPQTRQRSHFEADTPLPQRSGQQSRVKNGLLILREVLLFMLRLAPGNE